MKKLLLLFFLAACGPKTIVTTPPSDAADLLLQAVRLEGEGGLSAGVVIVLQTDTVLYRVWNGPDKLNPAGNNNRVGNWWTFDAPTGPAAAYRKDYAICHSWNDLTWVTSCKLKAGSVVAVGPTQSVAAGKCSDPNESYKATKAQQVFVPNAWAHPNLDCSDLSHTFKASQSDLSVSLY